MSRTWSGERHLISDVTAWRDSILTRENTMFTNFKIAKIRDKRHRRFVASLPCVICRRTDVQAAHISSGNGAGMGLKSGDNCIVPLCCTCHTQQHKVDEVKFWEGFGGIKKATRLANDLYYATRNRERAMMLLEAF